MAGSSEFGDSPPFDREQVENLLDRFDQAWQTAGVQDPHTWIASEPLLAHPSVIAECLSLDLEWRWRRNRRVTTEWYEEQIAAVRENSEVLQRLLEAECRVRATCGTLPSVGEIQSRYPALMEPMTSLLQELRKAKGSSPLDGGSDRRDPSAIRSLESDEFRQNDSRESAGNYEIREELGRGGFATVVRARCRRLDRDVALKRPHPQYAGNPELNERFLREARAAAKLRHSAIVPILEVGVNQGLPFIAMEYIAGSTLSDVMIRESPSAEQSAWWVLQIAEALHYAHRNGIVHRDVKPSNILIGQSSEKTDDPRSRFGVPFLTDFGLALQADAAVTLTRDGDLVGTPAYSSPEQARGLGHSADARTDVYSLGVVLFELLCGRTPFQGTATSILHQVLSEDSPSPSQFRAGIPLDLETICLKALAREPRLRYPTAAAMAEDLRAFLDHRPISARRISIAGRVSRWCQRRPALAATILVAVLSIIAVSVASYRRVTEERDRYLLERDRAQENLYRALISDAHSQLRSRDTGWWWQAMSRIRQAAELDVVGRDTTVLRELAIQCMGTEYPAFQLRSEWKQDAIPVSITLSHDSLWTASSSPLGGIEVRETSGGRRLFTSDPETGTTLTVAFHSSQKILFATTVSGDILVWDFRSGSSGPGIVTELAAAPVRLNVSPYPLRAIAVFPNGTQLVVGSEDGRVHLVRISTDQDAKEIRLTRNERSPTEAHNGPVISLTVSPDNARIVSGSADQTTRQWETQTGRLLTTWSRGQTPLSVCYSGGGDGLLISEAEGFGFVHRNIRRDTLTLANQVHTGAITRIADTVQNGILTGSEDGTIRLFSPRDWKELAIAQRDYAGVQDFQLGQDRKTIAAAHGDGMVRIWNLLEPQERMLTGFGSQSVDFLGATHDLVDSHRVLRTTEWDPLAGQNYVLDKSLAVALTPDQSTLVRGFGTSILQIRNLTDGRTEDWSPDDTIIQRLAFSKDGATLVTASETGRIQIWDWPSRVLNETIETQLGRIGSLVFRSDANLILVSGEQGVVSIHRETRPSVMKSLTNVVPNSALVAGRDFLVVQTPEQSLEVRDTITGDVRRRIPMAMEGGALHLMADEKTLIAAAQEQTLRFWDVESGEPRPSLQSPGQNLEVHWMATDDAGTLLVTGGERGQLALWDLNSRTQLAFSPTEAMTGQWLPDDSGVLYKHSGGSILIWDIASITEHRQALLSGQDQKSVNTTIRSDAIYSVISGAHSDAVWGIATSQDGTQFATASHDQTVKIWDAKLRIPVHTMYGHQGIAWCVAYSPNGQTLVSGGTGVITWNAGDGALLGRYTGHTGMVTSVAFHPGGRMFAACDMRGSITLHDLNDVSNPILLHEARQPIHSLAFHPSGKWLAAGGNDHRISLWDLQETEVSKERPREPDQILSGHRGAVRAVRYSPDGSLLASGSEQGVILLWNTKDHSRLVELKGGTGQIRCLAFSRDQRYLAGAAYVSRTIVWDLERVRSGLKSMNLDW